MERKMRGDLIQFLKEMKISITMLILLGIISIVYLGFGLGKTAGNAELEAPEQQMFAPQQQNPLPVTPEGEIQGGGGVQPELEIQGQAPGQPPRGVRVGAGVGFPTHTSLGISIYPIDPFTQERLSLNNNSGVVIHSVAAGGVAEKAGLKSQDVITRFGTWEIESVGDFKNIETQLIAGDRYKIRFIRDGRKETAYLVFDPTVEAVALAGVAQKVWLGADVQQINKLIQNQLGLENDRGVIVSFVEKGSPAEKGGVRQGDVIREVDGRRVRTITELQSLIASRKASDRVQLTLIRGNAVVTPWVTLALKSAQPPTEPPTLPGPEVEVEAAWIGLDLEPMSKAEAQELNLPPETQGMVVAAVTADSPGEKAGLEMGDVILAVNGKTLTSVQMFQEAAENANGAVLDVLRAGRHLYITVPPPTAFTAKPGLPGGMVQVAQSRMGMVYKKIVLVSSGETLFDQVAPDYEKSPFMVVYNPNDGTTEVVRNPNLQNPTAISNLIIERGYAAVITGRIDPNYKSLLVSEGIRVYAGVFGHLYQAVQMYRDNRLILSDADTGSGGL